MKKFLSIVLCLLVLCACGSPTVTPETPAQSQMQTTPQEPAAPEAPAAPAYDYLVGTARREINPDEPMPLCGYHTQDYAGRKSQSVRDDLFATAIAVTDRQGETVILFAVDLVAVWAEHVAPIRAAISEKTGVPAHHILLSASHTHSGPDQKTTVSPYLEQYDEKFILQCAQAGIAAFEDRKPAELYTAVTETDGLNFVRHYLHANGDITGIAFGSSSSKRIAHLEEPDPTMSLIRFVREGAKDVLLMNWQAHPTLYSYGNSSNKEVTADYVGGVRRYLEGALDCEFAFFQGAGADLMPTSDLGLSKTKDLDEFGKFLGDTALAALAGAVKHEAGSIKVSHNLYDARVNHQEDDRWYEALIIAGSMEISSSSAANKLAREMGFISYHHATHLLEKYDMPETYPLELDAVLIGDVGFATAPNELFHHHGVAIREGSPCDVTFVLSNANDRRGYLPALSTFEYGSYETGISYFEPGTGEAVAQFLAEKLTELTQ